MVDAIRELFCPVHGVFAPGNWQLLVTGLTLVAGFGRTLRAGWSRVLRVLHASPWAQVLGLVKVDTCKACLGWGCIRSSNGRGVVREYVCVRCFGTGDEPRGFLHCVEALMRRQHVDRGFHVTPWLVEKPRSEK